MGKSIEKDGLRPQLELLKKHGANIDWKQSPKGFLPLVRELHAGESTIRYVGLLEAIHRRIRTGLIREVGAVNVYVYHNLPDGRRLQLVEDMQVFNSGETRRRGYRWVSEKVEGQEPGQIAAHRGLEEELFSTDTKGAPSQDRLTPIKSKFIVEPSKTYPGLRSGKTIHDFKVHLTDEEYERNRVTLPSGETVYGFKEEQKKRPDGKTTYFVWQEISKKTVSIK